MTAARGFGGIGVAELLVLVVLVPLALFPWWRILRRMGWSPLGVVAWLIAFSVPGVNFLALWYLAFTAWPAGDR